MSGSLILSNAHSADAAPRNVSGPNRQLSVFMPMTYADIAIFAGATLNLMQPVKPVQKVSYVPLPPFNAGLLRSPILNISSMRSCA